MLQFHLPAQEHSSIVTYKNSTITPADTTRLMEAIARGAALEQHHPDSALRIYSQTLRESKHLGFADAAMYALFRSGLLYYRTGMLDSALSYYHHALYYAFLARKHKQMVPAIYCNIGVIYTTKGYFQKAIQYYDSAIQAGTRYGMLKSHLYLINTYINIGGLYVRSGNYKASLYYADMAIIASLRKKYREQLAIALLNKGEVYRLQKNYTEAKPYYLKATRIAEKYKYAITRQNAYAALAELLIDQGDSTEAAFYHAKLTQTGDIQTPVYNAAIPNYNMGINHLKLKNYKEAEHYLLLALKSIQELNMQEEEMIALSSLAEVYEKTSRYAQALEQHKKYVQLKDSIQQLNKLKVINELDIKYRSSEKDKQIALQANAARIRNMWIAISAVAIILLLVVLVILVWYYRQRQKIYHHKDEITRLKAMIKGEEKERTRLARELHDGIGGMMAAISMGLSHLKEKKATGKPYHQLESLVEETTHEIRRTAHNLIPSILERESLQEALRQYCAGISIKEGLVIETYFNGPVNHLEPAPSLLVYRMVQELLQNVVKHASATLAEVQITLQEDILSIVVEDNGKGFDPEAVQAGMGLSNLQYRVNALHGHLSINSIKSQSTTVYIELQMEKLKLI